MFDRFKLIKKLKEENRELKEENTYLKDEIHELAYEIEEIKDKLDEFMSDKPPIFVDVVGSHKIWEEK